MMCRSCCNEVQDGIEICPKCGMPTGYRKSCDYIENVSRPVEDSTKFYGRKNMKEFERYKKYQLSDKKGTASMVIMMFISFFVSGMFAGFLWVIHAQLKRVIGYSVRSKSFEESSSSANIRFVKALDKLIFAVYVVTMLIGLLFKLLLF